MFQQKCHYSAEVSPYSKHLEPDFSILNSTVQLFLDVTQSELCVCLPPLSNQKFSEIATLCSYQLVAAVHHKSFSYANVSEHISDSSSTCHDLIMTPTHNFSVSMAFFL